MGAFSKIVPKDYPISPDIEDRRHENDDERVLPELVIRSAPASSQYKDASYKHAREARKKSEK